MKKIFSILKNRWAEYLLEIIVIIIGISLTLVFNNWKEYRAERKEEIKLLQSIRENLVTDTLNLEGELNVVNKIIYGHEKMLTTEIDTFSMDSINRYTDFFASYTKFQGTNIGYEELKQSKSSVIITNRKLLQSIITHYEQKHQLMAEWNEIDKGFVLNDVLPFLNKNMTYTEGAFLYNDAATTLALLKNNNQFKNMVKSGSLFKEIIKMVYLKLKKETVDLIKIIDTELEKLD